MLWYFFVAVASLFGLAVMYLGFCYLYLRMFPLKLP